MMKEQIKKMREENGGFTLAELLIVVAIIAVLVAIAIPVFTSALHSSQEAADEANCRSLYADLQVACLENDGKAVTDGTLTTSATDATSLTLSDGEQCTLVAGTVTVEFVTDNAGAATGHYKVTWNCSSDDNSKVWGGASA